MAENLKGFSLTARLRPRKSAGPISEDFVVFALFALLSACGPKTAAPAVPAAAPVAVDALDALKAEAASLWDQRGDKAQLQAALAKYASIYATDPTNRDAVYHLTRGWYFLGDGHETEKEAKLSTWATAIEYGNKCLAMNKEFSDLLAKGDETEASAARAFTKDDLPCLYWTSSALGKWAKLTGIGVTLKHLPTVKAYMTRVGELDNSYYYNGPERYWGAYYAAIPSFAGQDLNKSKEFFDKSLAANPNFFGTHVLLAGEWAVKKQDKATFEKELNWVIAGDANSIPEVKPEMEAAQRMAKDLLAQEGDLFAN